MMFFVCCWKKWQSSNDKCNMTILWPLLVTSFIGLTSSGPSLDTTLPKKGIKMEESSRLAGMIDRAGGSSYPPKDHGYPLNSRIEAHSCRNNAVNSLRSNKESTSYFWDRNLFNYKLHAFWMKLDPKGRELEKLGPRERVEDLGIELPLLLKKLKGDRSELKRIDNSDRTKTAYRIFSSSLKGIEKLITQSSGGKKWNGRKISSDDEMENQWKTLAPDYNNRFEELVNLIFNHRFQAYHRLKLDDMEAFQKKLRTQAFSTINIFTKYRLINKEMIEEWINTNDVITVLTEHLKESCKPTAHAFFDLQESFSNSQASQHVGFLLTLLNKDSWRYIEYEYLRSKSENILVSSGVAAKQRLLQIWSKFRRSDFDKDTLGMFDKKKTVIKYLIEDFEKHSLAGAPEESMNYQEYDLLYGMIHFIMKHHKETFIRAIKDEHIPESLSSELQVFKDAIDCLKDSLELSFIIKSGFWTTQINADEAKHLIKLKEVSISKLEPIELVNNFGLFFEEDKNLWMEKLRTDAIQRNIGNNGVVQNVAQNCQSESLPQKFGTNFLLKDDNGEDLSQNKMKGEKKKRVSKLFLSELTSWISLLETLQNMYERDVEILEQRIKLPFLCKKMKAIQGIKQRKITISHFGIISFLRNQISRNINEASPTHEMILRRTVALNNEIIQSDSVSKTPQLT